MMLARYSPGARVYDVVSMERWIYRPGRCAAIAGLQLRRGNRVLDVGCGTGLNFALLADAVGPTGHIVGVDASPSMLRQARRRLDRNPWQHVTLLSGDAARLEDLVDGRFDAVLFTYSLAVIENWRTAWEQAVRLLDPGGRIAVVDTALPTGRWRWLAPLALLALFTGGVDRSRQVWRQVDTMTDARHVVLQGGHVHVAVGRKRFDPHTEADPLPDGEHLRR